VPHDTNGRSSNHNINTSCTSTIVEQQEERKSMMYRYDNATWRMYERITMHRCGRYGYQPEYDQSCYNNSIKVEQEGSICDVNGTIRHDIDETKDGKGANHPIRSSSSQFCGSSIVFKQYPFALDINHYSDTHCAQNEGSSLRMNPLVPGEDVITQMKRSKTMTSLMMNTETQTNSNSNDNRSARSPSSHSRHHHPKSSQEQCSNQFLMHDTSPRSIMMEPSQQQQQKLRHHHDETHWNLSRAHKPFKLMESVPSFALPENEIMIHGLSTDLNHSQQHHWYLYHHNPYSTDDIGDGGVSLEDDIKIGEEDKQDFSNAELDSSVFELDL
jgi:hypothetical protein